MDIDQAIQLLLEHRTVLMKERDFLRFRFEYKRAQEFDDVIQAIGLIVRTHPSVTNHTPLQGK